MAATAGILTKSLTGALIGRGLVGSLLLPSLSAANTLQPCRGMAARKGTREKARKKKVKVEVKKIIFDPRSQRDKRNRLEFKPKMINDLWKQTTTDDVYPVRYYRQPSYTFEEAINMHRETHHPTMYNQPNAFVKLSIECDLHGEKKTKFLDKIGGVADIPHPFDQQLKRTVIVFTKNSADVNPATEAGATLVGGVDLIKGIQIGDVPLRNVDYVVATNEIISDVVPLRGLFRKQYPLARNGTLTDKPVEAVKKLMNGVEYNLEKDDREPEYGWLTVNIGTLNMPTEHLKANMMKILDEVKARAPNKKKEAIIWRLKILCPPSGENFKLDLFELLGIEEEPTAPKEKPVVEKEPAVDDGDDEKVAVKQ